MQVSQASTGRSPRRTPRWVPPLATAAAIVLVSRFFLLSGDGSHPRPAQVAGAARLTATTGTPPKTPWPFPVDPPPPTHPPRGLTQDELNGRLSRTIAKIERLAKARDPDFGFAALETNAGNRYVDGLAVYRSAADPAGLRALYATVVPPGMTISYGHVRLSGRQLTHLTGMLDAQEARFRKAGVHLTAWGGVGFDDYDGRFDVYYDPAFSKPGPELLRPFEIYGADAVVLIPGGAEPAAGG